MNSFTIAGPPLAFLEYFGAFFYVALVDFPGYVFHRFTRFTHIVATEAVEDAYSQVRKMNINDGLLIAHQDGPSIRFLIYKVPPQSR